VAEAAGAGVPSIAHAVGGIPELIEDGVTGFLVPPGDSSTFMNRVVKLCNDRKVLNQLSAAAHSKAVEEFCDRKGIRKLLDLTESVA
jgi:glycosyltransferase involved in cell wall biosynthesis